VSEPVPGRIGEPVPGDGAGCGGAADAEAEEARIREELLVPRREEAFRRWLSEATAQSSVKVRAELLEKLAEGKT